ncbi:Protein of unknown function [Pyronema omphalodes CBS 100304]|uniref:Uncharacterized protein n=1 Tax=Pyronema omphalodes (strain CBS 100304) TaxID=1076935 RepID=U4L918_PYROM|nr:Protein of unknown function [Pyronema omphalodes CBS 100304]
MKIFSIALLAALGATAMTSALPQSKSLEIRDETDYNGDLADKQCLWSRCTIGGKIDCRPGYVDSGKRRTCGRAMMVKILCCPT